MEEWRPIAGFFFLVEFGRNKAEFDMAFSEVSGLSVEIETEELEEGGESRFKHRLPKRRVHGNFVCKRALQPLKDSELSKWVHSTLEGDFGQPIKTTNAFVSLLDEKRNKVSGWSVINVYPVKWSLAPFDSARNELAIETIEFACHAIERKL